LSTLYLNNKNSFRLNWQSLKYEKIFESKRSSARDATLNSEQIN